MTYSQAWIKIILSVFFFFFNPEEKNYESQDNRSDIRYFADTFAFFSYINVIIDFTHVSKCVENVCVLKCTFSGPRWSTLFWNKLKWFQNALKCFNVCRCHNLHKILIADFWTRTGKTFDNRHFFFFPKISLSKPIFVYEVARSNEPRMSKSVFLVLLYSQ